LIPIRIIDVSVSVVAIPVVTEGLALDCNEAAVGRAIAAHDFLGGAVGVGVVVEATAVAEVAAASTVVAAAVGGVWSALGCCALVGRVVDWELGERVVDWALGERVVG
jgi:hypothetical protein